MEARARARAVTPKSVKKKLRTKATPKGIRLFHAPPCDLVRDVIRVTRIVIFKAIRHKYNIRMSSDEYCHVQRHSPSKCQEHGDMVNPIVCDDIRDGDSLMTFLQIKQNTITPKYQRVRDFIHSITFSAYT